MKSIIIIGYMGAGKTSVGKTLAKKLGYDFYDLDWFIEERFHTRIPDLFKEKGEDAFRDIERRMLHETAEFEDIVLACGGGTPCFFDNIDYMNNVGTTIFLNASVDTILNHLKISHAIRPLLQGKTEEEQRVYMEEQIKQRMPFYSKAQFSIDVNVLDSFAKIDLLVENIIQMLQAGKAI